MLSCTEDVETMWGPMRVPLVDGKDLIIDCLRSMREWGRVETEIVASLVDARTALWDVGAFVGSFSVGVASLSLPSSIVAVEPSAEAFACLQSNLDSLVPEISNAVRAVVCSMPGSYAVVGTSPNNLGSRRYARSLAGADGGTGRTLAQLREDYGDYDLLKLDVEGMELDALKGDIRYLQSKLPTLWVECNEDVAALEVWGALHWLGYEVSYVAFPAISRKRCAARPSSLSGAYEAALFAAAPGTSERLSVPAGEEVIVRRVSSPDALREAMWLTPRWSRGAWELMSRAELIALLGRIDSGERRETFLSRNRTS